MEEKGEKGSKGESESDAELIDEETGLEVGVVERDSENLSIVFVEIGLVVVVVGLVPLFYFGGGFGRQGLVAVDAAGAADGGSEAIAGLGLGVGVDVGLEAVEEEEGDLEEGEGESED